MHPLAHTRTGRGEPLVLLHGLGMSRQAWNPVLPLLESRFDVIAIDLPGFGESALLPAGVEPHPAAIAAAVAATLRQLDVANPHVAGNSLGGWVSLELAAAVPVKSVTLFSPAGLWKDRTPLFCHVTLTISRLLARYAGPVLNVLVGVAGVRWVVFRQSTGRPTRMTPSQARQAIADMGTATAFRTTFRATLKRAYVPSAPILAPVSLSFGTRDLVLLPRQSRRIENLPAHTRLLPLAGTGHVPMTDDPSAVASLIIRTASRDESYGSGKHFHSS